MIQLFKLNFSTEVHFGEGTLESCSFTFQADTLFSALYIEALKSGKEKRLLEMAENGEFLLSDAFPFKERTLYVPKPIQKISSQKDQDPSERKKYKKLEYVPVSQIDTFLKGDMDIDKVCTKFGIFDQLTKASIRGLEETLPYHVETFRFYPDCGLYFVLKYKSDEAFDLISDLIDLLSYTGIGGKKTSGLGKFKVSVFTDKALVNFMNRKGSRFMLLSCALPKADEGEKAVSGASYLLEKRSGFIASETYAEELRKKKDFYVFRSGSCFKNSFSGGIYDVSNGGNHPVYRYAKGLFLEI